MSDVIKKKNKAKFLSHMHQQHANIQFSVWTNLCAEIWRKRFQLKTEREKIVGVSNVVCPNAMNTNYNSLLSRMSLSQAKHGFVIGSGGNYINLQLSNTQY